MIDISLSKTPIVFAPTSVIEQVVQNVRMILATMYSDVPNFRNFGLKSNLDAPLQTVQIKSRVDIINQIKENEPRAKVENINFQGDALNGHIEPIVRISINDIT